MVEKKPVEREQGKESELVEEGVGRMWAGFSRSSILFSFPRLKENPPSSGGKRGERPFGRTAPLSLLLFCVLYSPAHYDASGGLLRQTAREGA